MSPTTNRARKETHQRAPKTSTIRYVKNTDSKVKQPLGKSRKNWEYKLLNISP